MGQKGTETKRHILAKAFLLFSQKGYEVVSMQDICTACGLSKGGLYRHYESKEQLFTELLQALQAKEDRQESALEAKQQPANIVLGLLLKHTREELQEATPHINLALYEFCIKHKDGAGGGFISAQLTQGENILTKLLEYGNDRKEFSVKEPREVAQSILILLEGLKMLGQMSPLSEQTMEGVFHQIWRLVGRPSENET